MSDESEAKYSIFYYDTQKEGRSSRGFTGHARATYANGDEYDGDYVDGRREGLGTYKFKNGYVYTGEFVDNAFSGLCTYEYKNRGTYKGMMKNSQRNGNGEFTYKSGDRYKGEWKDNKRHGEGTYFFAKDGSSFEGVWENGEFKKGSWRLENGLTFEGSFDKGQPFGEGVWRGASGGAASGRYEHVEEEENKQESIDFDQYDALASANEKASERASNEEGETEQPKPDEEEEEVEKDSEPKPSIRLRWSYSEDLYAKATQLEEIEI